MRETLRSGASLWCSCIILALLVGCDGRDARLERVVDQSMEQQAAQNTEMARLHKDMTTGTRELVEADAKARADFAAMHDDLQTQQAVVGQQRDLLELERRSLATERRRDQLRAIALENFGLVLACLAPLLLAGYVVYVATRPVGDEEVTELLVQELTSEHPLLFPAPATPALPGPNAAPPSDLAV